jgi:hypothetical protein
VVFLCAPRSSGLVFPLFVCGVVSLSSIATQKISP